MRAILHANFGDQLAKHSAASDRFLAPAPVRDCSIPLSRSLKPR
jgi:hypothetical protein